MASQNTKRKWPINLPAILLVTAAYLFVGLFPFYPVQFLSDGRVNGVTWTPKSGFHFQSPGIAYTEHAPVWLSSAIALSSLHLSLEVRTTEERQSGPARIFTISSDPYHRNLTIGQSESALIIRLRHCLTGINGLPEYKLANVFTTPGWHQIDIDISEHSFTVFIDGNKDLEAPIPQHPLSYWDTDYRLALGNELTADRAWLGDIRKVVVTVAGKQYDYLRPNALHMPQELPMEHEPAHDYRSITFLTDSFKEVDLTDWVVNFTGFVPFGWLIAMFCIPRRVFLFAILSSAALSLTIELGQLYLPMRCPSAVDFLLNTCGGTLGAWFAMNFEIAFTKRRHMP